MELNNNVHEKHVIARSYYLTWKYNNKPLEDAMIIWLIREKISNTNCDVVN